MHIITNVNLNLNNIADSVVVKLYKCYSIWINTKWNYIKTIMFDYNKINIKITIYICYIYIYMFQLINRYS